MTDQDKSRGYEAIAVHYIAGRGSNYRGVGIGAAEVAEWSRTLPEGASVVDIGCGTGLPITEVLVERGFEVYGVDASPSMVAAFRANFPGVPVECEAAEESSFFGRTFDAVVSWGLFFLLEEETQLRLITKVAGALRPGGRFLFTSPEQICTWTDGMSDQLSLSLGYEAYKAALAAEGLALTGTRLSVGDNFYYFVQKS
jgi:2-polyprenyl-3-methyl-5-hydroxy-6-metoxy-1,4-benzoquinol methylase